MFDKMTFSELRRKEVINICDGARLGTVCDMEIDVCSGTLLALIVPGETRLFGLVKNCEELVIPFCKIQKFGEDVILVEIVL